MIDGGIENVTKKKVVHKTENLSEKWIRRALE
jgi:hypothetical protein